MILEVAQSKHWQARSKGLSLSLVISSLDSLLREATALCR